MTNRPTDIPPDNTATERPAVLVPLEVDRWRRLRRRAGKRLLAVAVVGIVVQIGGWVLCHGHPLVQGVGVLGAPAAMLAAVGLLTPRPPGGFWNWKNRGPQVGFDLLAVVTLAIVIVPSQIPNYWLQGFDLGVALSVLLIVGPFAVGALLLVGITEVRRRRRPRRPAPTGRR